MTEIGVAHLAVAVADTVVLLAIVLLTVAPLAYSLLDIDHLFLPGEHRFSPIVIRAPSALADARHAGPTRLEAYAVELAALPTPAIARLDLLRWLLQDSILSRWE